MLPFLMKKREQVGTVMVDHMDHDGDELEPQSKLKEMQELLLDTLMAKILFKMNDLYKDEGDLDV